MRDTAARETLRAMGLLREQDGQVWLELTTSGTSAVPRTVVRSLASWEDSFDHVTRLTGLTAADRVLVPAPPSGSMFAFAHAHAAHLGADVVALDRWSPAAATEAVRTCTAAHLTPAMLATLLDRGLGDVRTVVCAGASLPESTRREADKAGAWVVDYYGAAELSFVAMRAGERLEPFPEVDLEIREGVIWARSPWLADGYARGQSGPLHRDDDGFATVGDLGRWDHGSGLVVVGRGDDVVTTGGATVVCADVEAALLSLPGVTAAVVVGTPHPGLGEVVEAVVVGIPHPGVGEVVEAFGVGTDPDTADVDATDVDATLPGITHVREAAAHLLDRTQLPRRWHAWADLPLTAAGKVDRAEVRARILASRAEVTT
ncbi:AMP-binding protein [Knoellia sp. CPCC 206450]|uniref:AMP-binding protein n=1 Tax=Knoellia tibetensis TaxID=3404798 RepID=UPI003B42B226